MPKKKKKILQTHIAFCIDESGSVAGDHGKFDVFIQSTSVNRKIPAGTEVMYYQKSEHRKNENS